MCRAKGIFPEPEKDPVIQIAPWGDPEPFIRNVFTLNTCGEIVGSVVISCKTETELLDRWADFVRQVDPDILTGYNINNFDFPYLLNRTLILTRMGVRYCIETQFVSPGPKHLRCPKFQPLGTSDRCFKSVVKGQHLQSKQMGRRRTRSSISTAEFNWIFFLILVRDYKMRSYTLNAVSYHFLQYSQEFTSMSKKRCDHSVITDLQNAMPKPVVDWAVYCLKDAYLPLRLLEKLMCVNNYMEMARVTGVPLSYLQTRGSANQGEEDDHFKSTITSQSMVTLMKKITQTGDDNFEGATVIEPKRDITTKPIATLDFSSLYRSIYDGAQFVATQRYFQSSVRKGLLPEILESLLGARKKAKADLKRRLILSVKRIDQHGFSHHFQVLDGRQLALKISANSVYGFTGAQVGKLPCLEISQSVTLLVVHMANGYKFDADVIYGDTDSVMVKFGRCDNVKRLPCALGEESGTSLRYAEVISPIKFGKRYAGLYFTQPTNYDKMDLQRALKPSDEDNWPNKLARLHERLPAEDPHRSGPRGCLGTEVDISQLVITKRSSPRRQGYTAKHLTSADAGSCSKVGDRVPLRDVLPSQGYASYQKAEVIYGEQALVHFLMGLKARVQRDPILTFWRTTFPLTLKHISRTCWPKPLLMIFEPILASIKPNPPAERRSYSHPKLWSPPKETNSYTPVDIRVKGREINVSMSKDTGLDNMISRKQEAEQCWELKALLEG
ncbi:hypothetical protein TCAL_04428 [Tigriopus californicus]|uniref:DNA polymerase n=1 Tax=Tigriopus californicus TaxID=6832 RepID=A0A553NV97_TIGCA|nr:hypothetical protein TCAL_04428 [Tigriopus californicus]